MQPLPPNPPVPSAIQTLAFWRDPHSFLEWCRRRYGTSFTVNSFGMPPLVFMSDPVDIRTIVNAPADILHPGAGGGVIAPLVGERSFMLADEDDPLVGRRAILPALHRGAVHDHADTVEAI